MDDKLWMLLLLGVFAQPGVSVEEVIAKLGEDWKRAQFKKEHQENCDMVEWVDDMNARIPFCKITGEVCNNQCLI